MSISLNTVIIGNCSDILKTFDDNIIDSVITDPPYELGMMNKSWDSSGIAYNVSMWSEVLRVLKPGGHILSFGGTRTYHKMACAVEEAGFEIRDQLQWIFGQGFPKNMNIGNGLGTALKPANEPIVLARKPIKENTIKNNVEKYGTGALNIELSRIGERWPSNILLDEESARLLDEQTGTLTSGIPSEGNSHTTKNVYHSFNKRSLVGYGDSGGASRFFYCAKASRKEKEFGLEHRDRTNVNDGRRTSIDNPYQRGDTLRSNIHPTVKPIALMEYLIRLITPINGIVLDPFCGSGTTLIAAKNLSYNYIGIEMNSEYANICNQRLKAVNNLNKFFV